MVSVSGKDADVVASADFLAGFGLAATAVLYAFLTSYRGMQPFLRASL